MHFQEIHFEEIYRDELDYVWSTLRRLGIPDRDREDLAHDVFVVVHRRLPDFELGRPVRPWLFGIAFRVVAGHRRRKRVVDGTSEAEGVEARTPHESAVEGQRRALVQRALASLSLEKRAVIVMHDIDEVPVTQVADALEIPLNTAYSRLRLARAEINKAVRRLTAADGVP